MESGQATSDEATASAANDTPTEPPAQEDRGCKPLLQGDSSEQKTAGTRRDFLERSAKKLAYISPVVLLLRPRPACASRIYS